MRWQYSLSLFIYCINGVVSVKGKIKISTHTLRGERDMTATQKKELLAISTHTLRGERDHRHLKVAISIINFNSHAPWGA